MKSDVRIKEWESERELLSYMQSNDSRKTVVVADADNPKKFYSFSFQSEAGPCEIGIMASFHGVDPGVILVNEGKTALIGLDEWVTGVDISTGTLVFRKNIVGVFFEFIRLPSDDQVLVVHEIGALRVDASGLEIWSVATDIVGEFFLDGLGHLVLVEWDGGARMVVDLNSGQQTAPYS